MRIGGVIMNNLQLLDTAVDMAFYSEKFAPVSGEAVGKAISYGLPFSLFGFSVVFGVLALLMIVIYTFGRIFGAAEAKTKAPAKPAVNNEPKKEKAKQAEQAPVAAAPVVSSQNDIVAAIIAAITAFRGTNGQNGGFRVVSFKKRK